MVVKSQFSVSREAVGSKSFPRADFHSFIGTVDANRRLANKLRHPARVKATDVLFSAKMREKIKAAAKTKGGELGCGDHRT